MGSFFRGGGNCLLGDVVVPGLPVIGNLLQLKEKKPHKTFARWAEIYGPVYSIKTGASTVVVLNSTDVAKEVTKLPFSNSNIFLLTEYITLLQFLNST